MFLLGRTITDGSSFCLRPWINCVYVLGWYSTFRSLVSTLTLGAAKLFPMLNILCNTRGIVLNHFFDIKCIAVFSCYVHKFQNTHKSNDHCILCTELCHCHEDTSYL